METALVGMYGSCGLIEDARLLFDKMSLRDIVSWSIMIDGSVLYFSLSFLLAHCLFATSDFKLYRH